MLVLWLHLIQSFLALAHINAIEPILPVTAIVLFLKILPNAAVITFDPGPLKRSDDFCAIIVYFADHHHLTILINIANNINGITVCGHPHLTPPIRNRIIIVQAFARAASLGAPSFAYGTAFLYRLNTARAKFCTICAVENVPFPHPKIKGTKRWVSLTFASLRINRHTEA